MGYYTEFDLRIDGKHFNFEEVPVDLLEDIGFNPFQKDCKWYCWEENMRSYSTKHPEKIYCLEGQGENPDDMWIAYFKNGKMQMCRAKIEFPKYDETKLE